MTPPKRAPQIVHGDCLEIMKMLPDNSVDSIVTDPPYGLGFMGKAWDALPPGREWAEECMRVLKPGGHLLAFGGTRTWHRLAVAVDDAGFEIRDSIAWLYGSGFPKSLDVSKAIDKRRDWTLVARLSQEIKRARAESEMSLAEIGQATLAATDGAYGKWYHRGGHMFFETGRSLPSRPEFELLSKVLPIAKDFIEVYAEAEREILSERPAFGIGGNGILGGHAEGATAKITAPATPAAEQWQGWGTALKPAFEPVVAARKPLAGTVAATVLEFGTGAINIDATRNGERWPANVILDESQSEALEESRYFYTAKPSKAERPNVDGVAHPTVKPLALMRWLVRLVTPPGGTVLEPFAGSGATVEACMLEDFHCIAIEREAEYLPLIQARIDRQDAA